MIWVWVGVGAGLGAPARYLADRFVQTRHDSHFPWGTVAVNVFGSFLLGLLTGAAQALSPGVQAAVGVGFCGALTTYSTFSYETMRLLENKLAGYAAANVLIALVCGFGAAGLGLIMGMWLT